VKFIKIKLSYQNNYQNSLSIFWPNLSTTEALW
jgi:hypothetical protein